MNTTQKNRSVKTIPLSNVLQHQTISASKFRDAVLKMLEVVHKQSPVNNYNELGDACKSASFGTETVLDVYSNFTADDFLGGLKSNSFSGGRRRKMLRRHTRKRGGFINEARQIAVDAAKKVAHVGAVVGAAVVGGGIGFLIPLIGAAGDPGAQIGEYDMGIFAVVGAIGCGILTHRDVRRALYPEQQ
jgi:hypothetical protein